MELDDFKTRWMETDAVRINTRAARAIVRAEDSLRRHWRNLTLELLLDAAALLLIGSFIGDHYREPRFLVPALALHAGVILLGIPLVRQVLLLRGVDYAEPVVAIQRHVERLRIEQIGATKWTLIAAPLLWTPLLIVAMKGLLGLDAWAIFEPRWLAANLLFGIAFIPLMLWASRKFAERMKDSPFLKRAMDDLAGRSLQSAKGFLDEVGRFEEPPSQAVGVP